MTLGYPSKTNSSIIIVEDIVQYIQYTKEAIIGILQLGKSRGKGLSIPGGHRTKKYPGRGK